MDGMKIKVPKEPKIIMIGDYDLPIKNADELKPLDMFLANDDVFLSALMF